MSAITDWPGFHHLVLLGQVDPKLKAPQVALCDLRHLTVHYTPPCCHPLYTPSAYHPLQHHAQQHYNPQQTFQEFNIRTIWFLSQPACFCNVCFTEIILNMPRRTRCLHWKDKMLYLVANRVLVLHFAFQHDTAGLKTSVGMVREACCDLMGRGLQLVKHQIRVKVAQCGSAHWATDRDSRSIGDMCASHDLRTIWGIGTHQKQGERQ